MDVLTKMILAERQSARRMQVFAVVLVKLAMITNKQGQHLYMMGEWTGYG
jgi:hypothetical protein